VGLTESKEMAPLSEEGWADSSLLLPAENRGRCYRIVLTGELLEVGDATGEPGLALAKMLAEFPVALLARLT